MKEATLRRRATMLPGLRPDTTPKPSLNEVHHDTDQPAVKEKPRTQLNRADLRKRKIGRSRRVVNAYARPIKKGALPPSSFHTLVAIHATDANGKVVRKFVVPRENVDIDMLAKTRTEQKASERESAE